MRMCSDVRILNDKTILQPYPMLNINFLLADIGRRKCKYFSVIDLSDSYRQIPLSKRSQEIATMSTIVGDFSPTTCIFGLKNLPFVFTKLMDQIFYSIRGIYMDFYIDDLVLFDPTFDLHIQHIEEVLKRLRNANLTAKPMKTFLCKKTVQFLGFTISKQGIATTDENIEKIKKFPIPVKQKDVRAFLGISNFYKRHIFQYGQIAQPLYELTKKLEGPFKWTKEANSAFEILKNKLTTAPILAFPDIDSKEPLIVTVDTSSIVIGYVLSQRQRSDHTGKLIERPICYGSTNLKGTQTKMGSTDLELTGVNKLDCWLRGVRFTLITDHKSLTYLIKKRMDEMKPAMARKIIFLQQYDFDIIHKHGVDIPHVDTLSRLVLDSNIDNQEDIEPVINNISVLSESDRPMDVGDLALGNIDYSAVRQFQKMDIFF